MPAITSAEEPTELAETEFSEVISEQDGRKKIPAAIITVIRVAFIVFEEPQEVVAYHLLQVSIRHFVALHDITMKFIACQEKKTVLD